MAANRLYSHFGHLLLAACFTVTGLMAAEHHGIVKSGGIPVPGATVTATPTQGDNKKPIVTTTDETGAYYFQELPDGVWSVSVESLGFVKATRDIGVVPDAPSPMWDLKYQSFEALTAPVAAPETAPAAPAAGAGAPATGAATPDKPAETKAPATPATVVAPATAAATPVGKNGKPAKPAKNGKNAPATPSGTPGAPSLNQALANAGRGGQSGGFTRLGVNQSGGGGGDQGGLDAGPPQDAGDMAAAGNQSFTINGSVSSGLDMQQPGGDWFGGGRGGPGGPGGPGGIGGDMGGMGPGGIPGQPGAGGDPTQAGMIGPGGGPGGAPGGRGGGGAPGGGGGRGGAGAGMMAGIPNIGGGGGGRGGRGAGGRGGAGGPGGRNPAAFGNNRRDPRSRYNFSMSAIVTNSAINARGYSITGQEVSKPNTQSIRSTLTAGGPLKIPHIFDTKGKGTFTLNYTLGRQRTGSTFSDLVPTDAEKAGDFSGLLGSNGAPIQLYNGATPYVNNQIPTSAINPVAQALLKYYPEPNFTGSTRFNYASSAAGYTNSDNINGRLSYSFNSKNQINGGIQYQRSNSSQPSVFAAVIPAWHDTTTNNGVAANASYIYHFSVRLIATTSYNYSKASQIGTPYWANVANGNIEGALGILGTDQAPLNWGPPTLNFTSSILGLSDRYYSFNHPETSTLGESVLYAKGAHQVTFGGGYSRREANSDSQVNPRGTYSFNGQATALNGNSANQGTGFDFADFLIGTPSTMSINVANSLTGATAAQLSHYATGAVPANLLALEDTPSGGDRYLRTSVYDIFVSDSWKVTPRFSVTLGVRWDYQAPTTELYGRLATLDLPANYQVPLSVYNNLPSTGLSVVAGQTGPATGIHYSDSLLNGKKNNFSPRFGFAFKPWSKHSTVFRGGFGIYYSPSIYGTLIGKLDAQTPFATSFTALNNNCNATLQNAFSLPSLVQLGCLSGNQATTSQAIAPDFRVGYTENWQMSVQQNLKWNTVATITYVGIKGTGQPQLFYPNSFTTTGKIVGQVIAPCAAGDYCPVGYQYESSNGNSTDQQLTVGLQRRLRSGLGGNVTYTFNKAIDDFGSTAQNWQDLAAERDRTAGIRNQTLNLSLQYSTGVGARGGGLVNGWKGVILRDWTVMPSIVVASGAPITITAANDLLTGANNGIIRANYIGGPTYLNGHLNPAAFQAPGAGQFGNLGPGALNGPMQFSNSINANRTFRLADRKNLTFSIQAQNPLNHPVVSSWSTSIGTNSVQFGLPSLYSGMRTVTATMRFNF